MKKFKISVSKNQKKFALVLSAEHEMQARDRVHAEGYSILSVEEYVENPMLGHTFSFEAEKKGEIRTGKVVGADIFKVYIKLRKDLGYRIVKLYDEVDAKKTDRFKEKLVQKLEEEYELFTGLHKTEKKEKKTLKQIENNTGNEDKNLDNFYLKKELDETYKMIDFVLGKLINLIDDKEIKDLPLEQKEKLKKIYNSIIKIKKSTNISKIKEVGELALLKIGIIELRELEKNKNSGAKKLLTDTNKLLKQIGSTKQFIEKDKDIGFIVNKAISRIVSIFSDLKYFFKKEKNEIDTGSHSYIKTELLLKKYREKLRSNTKEILKNLLNILFNSEKKEELFLRRKVIKQNITLFKAKQDKLNFSYTYVKKGYEKIFENIDTLFNTIMPFIFFIIYSYSLAFILYLNISFYSNMDEVQMEFIHFNYSGISYFLVLLFVYLSLYLKAGVLSLFFNVVFLVFIIIFGIINF